MSNPINKSGKDGEKRMKKFLDMYFTNGFDYNPSDGIDFIVHPAAKLEDRFYIDIKNQKGPGGRDLAVGGCVWDYQKQNGFKECYIVEGEFDFKPKVRRFANMFAKTNFVKFKEMCIILLKSLSVDNPEKRYQDFYEKFNKPVETIERFF